MLRCSSTPTRLPPSGRRGVALAGPRCLHRPRGRHARGRGRRGLLTGTLPETCVSDPQPPGFFAPSQLRPPPLWHRRRLARHELRGVSASHRQPTRQTRSRPVVYTCQQVISLRTGRAKSKQQAPARCRLPRRGLFILPTSFSTCLPEMPGRSPTLSRLGVGCHPP
jgi:hypothetical protein